MTEQFRPDPDQLLARLQSEASEQSRVRGRLKIFLGYAAGVGKTYAMLEAAHRRRAEGLDVVVGLIETHGRVETEALLSGLEALPRRTVEYRNVRLQEMDLKAVLDRRPNLVLIDELAHTNAPGVLHPKRYQDVEDILQAGISVYTTLNIQHLESLNDVVEQVTGVTVRETVPDRIIDEADEIELVDLPPDELLQRLREGKVYIPAHAERAIRKFFRKGNLTALRELSMRRAADRVDDQMLSYMHTRAIPGPWPATERLLVCISPSPLAERLIRSARRLAEKLNAEWITVYVETPDDVDRQEALRDRVTESLLLAEQLGAKTLIIPGRSVPESLLQYAHQYNITKIIVGKSMRSRWLNLLQGSIVDQLVAASGDIDVYVVSGTPSRTVTPRATLQRAFQKPWPRYAWAIALVGLVTFVSRFLYLLISPTNLVMLYLLVVVITALNFGRGPALLSSILSVLLFDFFLVPPYFTFVVADTEYILTFIGLFVVGLVISQLAARAREQAEAAQHRQAETAILLNLSRELAEASDINEIIQVVEANISQTFNRTAIIFLPEPGQGSRLRKYDLHSAYILDENELAVAVWSFENGRPAGRGTDTLSASEARYLPLKTANGVVGVLAVMPPDDGMLLLQAQLRLLEAFASQAAVAIERTQLAEQAQQAQLLQVTEKLQAALLNSISHDLRTPLVSITGVLSSLEEDGRSIDEDLFKRLVRTARGDAERLNRLVANLLDMSRLEADGLHLKVEMHDVQDMIGIALEQMKDRLEARTMQIRVEPNLPLAPMDLMLIVHVMANLLENAARYSPEKTQIDIEARQVEDEIQIQVLDHGPGIAPEHLERVFEKFYRLHQPENVSGTGLGLSISRGIVEAHGGRVWAENRPGDGAIFTVALPLPKQSVNAAGQKSKSRQK